MSDQFHNLTQSKKLPKARKLGSRAIATRSSMHSTVASISPRLTTKPFPFMRLPVELRGLVYKEVFDADEVNFNVGHSQPGDPLIRDKFDLVPNLLKASKQIYQEMRPLYFTWTRFQFSNLFLLRSFLKMIGPEMGAMVTWIGFKWSEKLAPTVFTMLAGLPNLSTLCISVGLSALPYKRTKERLMRRTGIKQLLAVRGIKELELSGVRLQFINHYNHDARTLHLESFEKFEKDLEKFIKAIQVVREPRQPRVA